MGEHTVRTALRRSVALALALLSAASATPALAAEGAIDLHLYGDANFGVQSHMPISNGFEGSGLDIFPTARYGNLDVLAEIVFEPDLGTNSMTADVERVQARYTVFDWLRFRAGRSHTAFGFYNDTYHHGQLFQLAMARPIMVAFEDPSGPGGILPAHMMGIGVDGKVPLGRALDFEYNIDVGNTHGYTPGEIALVTSRTESKAVNVRLRLEPKFLPGLIVGVNGMYDEIPAGPPSANSPIPAAGTGVTNAMQELIFGAHLAYVHEQVHLIAEFETFDHQDEVTKMHFRTAGGFAEFGYSFGDFTPYARGEYIKYADGFLDPWWQLTNNAGLTSTAIGLVGLNWAVMENVAAKLELRDRSDTGPSALQARQGVFTQFAFGF